MILNHQMRTSEYQHEQRISGQDKLRDIAKLIFHPSHIQHQLLTMMADRRINKALIRHTYASRKGYGQTAAALQLRSFLRKHRHENLWYAQGDIVKYYDHIRHDLIRENLERMFKDKAFVDAFMEPFEKFSPDGFRIPLGIRPSQESGNIALMGLDRFATEQLGCMGYLRYLDDFVFFGKTKGEVKWKIRRIETFLKKIGFELHVPKIHRVSEGLDIVGYVYYNTRNDMYWRSSNKHRWLRRRSKAKTPRRKRELDDAAWGMLAWGNHHCQRLFYEKTGIKRDNKKMAVKLNHTKIKRQERRDANGLKIIDLPKLPMQTILDKPVQVSDWVRGIETKHGPGRYALKVRFMGDSYKVIVNSPDVKSFIDSMEENGVTEFETVIVDKGGFKYAIDDNRTNILCVYGREVEEREGRVYYKETNEVLTI